MYLNDYSQIASGVSAGITFTTQVHANNFGFMGFQVVWTSHNSGNATVKLQSTLDGTNYNDYASSTVTITSGSSSQIYEFVKPSTARFVRVSYDPGSNTAGTIDVWVTRKGHV